MKFQIKPGFLFPTQFWTVNQRNIGQYQMRFITLERNYGVLKSNSGFQGYHSKDIKDLNNLPGIINIRSIN